jgi:drug/metabolite transporter (DMT)-like permease
MPQPSEFVLALILTAALLHALWNAVVKGSGDRGITIGLVAIGNAVFGIILIFYAEPPSVESYVFIALTIFIHIFYFIFLILAYRLGDFSQVYPIARGIAPVLVALVAMAITGETLPPLAWAGLLTISFGISILVFSRRGLQASPAAIGAALLTGLSIAGYTIADGMGVRVSGSPIGYIGWSFGLQVFLGFGFLIWRRNKLKMLSPRGYAAGLVGGLISGMAYALAIYAMSLTTLGTVSAIRESSVIMAALIGVVCFGERPWLPRVVAAIVVAGGIILLANG